MRETALALGLGLVFFVGTRSAAAQVGPGSTLPPERPYRVETAPSFEAPPQTSAWDRLGHRGVEVLVSGGVMLPNSGSPVLAPNLYVGQNGGVTGDPTGDILEGKESPYGPDPFGLHVAVGYRFFSWLSAGAFFSYAKFIAKDGTDTGDYSDGTSSLERQLWSVGAYGRYYLTSLHPRLQPWLEIGLGYSQDNASYVHASTQTTTGQPELQQFLLEEEGIVVPAKIGLDWRVAPFLAFGPSLGYARMIPTSGCVTVNVDNVSQVRGFNNLCSSPVGANGYGVFFGGIFAKVTIAVGPAAD
jgi:hypothetical protein